jgi:hypothetical protein
MQVETAMVFNFDRDADPLLNMLCGKTLEQALVEVHEEQQIKAAKHLQVGWSLYPADIDRGFLRAVSSKPFLWL